MNKEVKRKIVISIIGILGMISLIAGVSFAAFSFNLTGRQTQTINTGCLKVEMSDNGNLSLENAYPISDKEGLTSDPYTYTIENTCTVDAYYETTINVLDGSTLANLSKVKVALDGDSYLKPTIEDDLDSATLLEEESDVLRTYLLDEGFLKAGERKTFNLRTWIDYDVEEITGSVENKVIVNSEARQGNTLVYNTNSIGYFSGNRENLLKNVNYKNIADQSGIVETKEGNNTSYYFRGNPTNTVAFGSYNVATGSHQVGDTIRWKILSTNSDGSVNLITEESIGTSTYANVQNMLTSFYNTHLSDEEDYIKTNNTFCKEGATSGEYLAKIRTEKNNPTSKCNGGATYTKIGLPTVDELMYAGAVLDKANTNFYLYNGNSFMTSSQASSSTIYASNASKSIYEVSTSTSLGVRPVITVKKDTMLSGAGTETSPYYVTGKYSNPSTTSTDTTKPVITYARVEEKWSKTNKAIEISANDNETIAGYLVKTTNTAPSANDNGWEVTTSKKYTSVNTFDNGTYYVFAKDAAGNVSNGEKVVIARVDKTAPTCSIRLNSTPDSTLYKTLTIQTEETNIDLKGYSWDDDDNITTQTRKIKQNGVYKAYLTDLAGNKGSCQITVTSVTEFYMVVYKANGGVGEDKTDYAPVGGEYTLLKNTFTREGYGFVGWDTNQNATESTYSDKQEVTSLTTTGNTITLYAIWDESSYTVTADANGGTITETEGWTGTGEEASKLVRFNGTYGTLPTVTRSGYTFDGWYTAKTGGTKVTSTTTVTGTTAHTLYAHWLTNITVTAKNQTKTYDGTALTADGTCSVTSGTLSTGDTVTCTSTGSQKNAGTSTKTLSTVVIKDSNNNVVTDNYKITKANGTLKVEMKTLTVKVDNKERDYGSSATQSYSYTATGFVNGEDESVLSGTATYKVKNGNTQVTVDSSLAAGTYTIQLTGLIATNYDIEIQNGTLTVNKINATCPNITGYEGTYDGSNHTITVGEATGGTLQYRTSTTGTWSTTKPTRKDNGTTTVYVQVDGDANHNTKDCGSKTIKINKKEVTVKAENKSMTYGGSAPTYSYTVTGAISGETSVSGQATYTIKDNGTTVSNVSTADAGTYTITPSGLTAGSNYTIKYTDGTLTIERSKTAQTGSCATNLVYDGDEKTLASGAVHASYTNNKGTSAQNETAYQVTVKADDNYAFSDGATSKTLSCVIHRADGYVTLDSDKTVEFGTTSTTFSVKTNHGGTLSVTDDSATATSSISGTTVTLGSLGSLSSGTTVKATVTSAQTANYKSASKVFTLTIGNKKDATTGSCATNLVYDGNSHSLASGGSNVSYTNNSGTNAGNDYEVTVKANQNHAFSDGTTQKTLTCSIAKATPTITLSSTSGTTIVGQNLTFNEKASVAGKFTNTSSATSKATVSPATSASEVAANTNAGVTVTPVATGEAVITVTFTPSDTNNYNSITATSTEKKTYTATIVNKATIPTASTYCKDLTYNGESQTLVNNAGTGFSWDSETTSGKNATTYTVKANLASGYRWSDNSTGQKTITCSIGKKDITIKADDKEMTYGGSAPSYSYTVTGAISGETAVTGTASYAVKNSGGTTITVGTNTSAGTYTIHVSGLSATSNYNIKNTNTGTLTVGDKKDATTGSCASNLTYDGEAHTLASGGSNVSYTNNSGTNADTYTVTVKANTNHAFSDGTTSKTLSCTIGKRAVTVTATNQEKTYDKTALTANSTCSVTSTTKLVTGHTATCTSTGSQTNAGTSTKTLSTVVIKDANDNTVTGNYTITKANGTLKVNPKTLTATVSASNKTYDRTTDATCSSNVTLSGVISGDTVTASASTSGTFDNKNVGTGKTVTCKGITLAGDDKDNYDIAAIKTTTASISAKALTPTVSASNKTYDGTTDATCSSTVTLSGVISGDTVTASASTSGTFNNKNVGTGKTVTCTGITLAGADKGNYSVASSKTTTANITKKSLTVTADDKSMTYGGTAPSYSYTVKSSDLVTGDTASVVTGTASYAVKTSSGTAVSNVSTADAGIYKIHVSGLSATNYELSYQTGDLTIGKKTDTVTITKQTKTYNGNEQETVVSSTSGLTPTVKYYSDSSCQNILSTEPDSGGPPISVGTYYAIATTPGNTNYSAGSSGCKEAITINPKSVSVTWGTTTSFTYNGSGQAPTATVDTGIDRVTMTVSRTTQTNASENNYTSTASCVSTTKANANDRGGCNNFTLTNTTKTFTINPKALTPTVSASNKTYDGTTDATCSSNVTLSGVISGDTVTASASTSGTFDNKNVGTGKTVTCTGITLAGADKGNYSVASSKTTTANITKYTPSLVISKTSASVNYNATGNFTSTPTTISACLGDLKATSASSNYVTVSTSSSGTYGETASYSDAASATAKTFYYKGVAYTSGNNVTVSYVPEDTDNCNSAPTKTIAISVAKVDATCPTTFTAYSGTYDGDSHTITATGHSGGTLQYRTSTTGTWSNTKPSATNVADSKTVYVQVLGDSNHNTVDCGSKTITINPKKCTAPSNVAISTAGRVSWTNSSTSACETHQVKVASGSYETATSGVDKNSDITSSTGSRSVSVIAKAPNSNYSDSDAETDSVTVYAITFASNDTDKGTVSPTSKNVISGATLTTSGNNLLIKGVTTGTTTTTLATVTPTPKTGYKYSSWSKTSGSLTSAQTITATFTGNTYTATFYYQSNTTSGNTTVSHTTASCTVTSGSSCSATIPSAVINSGGTYNNDYAGLNTAVGADMSPAVGKTATTVTLSDDTDYYSIYSTEIKIYYPSSASATTNKSTYQNQWFTSNTAMATTVLSSSSTGTTTNATAGANISGYSLVGFNTAASANTANSGTTIATLAQTNSGREASRNVYQVENKEDEVEATFYYSTAANGTVGSATSSGTRITYLRPTSTTAAGTSVSEGTITAPTLSDQVVPTGTARISNWAKANSNFTVYSGSDINTGTTKYYAVYRQDIALFEPTSTTVCTSTGNGHKWYRNAFINTSTPTTGTTKYAKVLSTTDTGTTDNASYTSGVSGYTFVGFATGAGTGTPTITYESLTGNTTPLRDGSSTAVFAILSKSVEATFYYSNSAAGAKTSTTAEGTQYLRCSSTSAATIVNSTITPTLTGETAPTGTASIGWSTSNTSLDTVTATTANTAYYKAYRKTVTVYKPISESEVDTTDTVFYRNAFYGTGTNYTKVLSTTKKGTTDNASYTPEVSGYTLVGFATVLQSTNPTYATLIGTTTPLRDGSHTTAYAVLKKENEITLACKYQSNTTSGSATISTANATGTRITYLRPSSSTTAKTEAVESNLTIPTAVTGSGGTYNNKYVGVTDTTGSMTTKTLTTGSSACYAVYRTTVKIYYPTSTTATGNKTVYQNQWFSDASTLSTTVLSTSTTGTTTNATAGADVSGYSLEGFNTAASANTANSGTTIATLAQTNSNKEESRDVYQIEQKTETFTGTFYYNDDTTCGGTTVAHTTNTGTRTTYLRPTSTTAAGTSVSNVNISVPDAVSESKGPYNGTYVGVSKSTSSMSEATPNTSDGSINYYAFYRSNVTIYYPKSTSATASTTVYRNEFFEDPYSMSTVLATTNTGTTTNANGGPLMRGYAIVGYSTSAGTNTATYESINELRLSCNTTVYQIEKSMQPVIVTFYYSNSEAGARTSTTAEGTRTTYLRPTSTTAAGTSVSEGTITAPTLTGETAPTGTATVSGFATSASSMSTTTTYTTANTSYYRVYRSTVKVYKPVSTSLANATNTTFYRNAYYGTETNYTKVLATSATGTSDNASYTSGISGYSVYGYATSASSMTKAYESLIETNALRDGSDTTVYAVLYKNVEATFYYSNSIDGAKTSTTSTGKTYIRCASTSTAETMEGTIPAPTLTDEVAPTGTEIVTGFATSASSMSTITTYSTGSTKYYRVYRNKLTIYRPTSASAASSTTAYRNAYYGTGTNYTPVVSTSSTGTSNMTSVSGLWSSATFVGYSTSSNTTTVTSGLTTVAESIKAHSSTTYYVIATYTTDVTATFYYNDNTTCGGTTVASKTASGTQTRNVYCSSTSAATTSVKSNGTISVPSEVSGSIGPYNGTYVNVASGTSSMSAATVNTGTTTYYAFYRSNITRYYPSSASATSSDTLYRNEFFTSTSAISTVLATTNTGTTTNAAAKLAVSGYGTLVGFSTSASANTATYASIEELRTSCETSSVYEIDKKTETKTATFYYNSNETSGSTTISTKTATGTQTTFLRPTSTSAAGTSVSNGSITIPTEVTGSGGTYNNKYVGVATALGTMTSQTTANTGTLTYYAVYRTTIKIYFPTSETEVSYKTVAQNQWFTKTNEMSTTVLATTNTGTTTNATAGALVSGYGTLVGFNTAASTNTANSGTTIATLAQTNSSEEASRNVYQVAKKTETKTATFYYSTAADGTVGSATSSGTRTTYLRPTSTTAAGTSVSEGTITAPTLSDQVVPTGTARISNWAKANSNFTVYSGSDINTGTTKYYAVYRQAIALREPTSATECLSTSNKWYRNAFISTATPTTGTTKYTKVLSTTNTGTTDNASYTSGVSGYTFVGFATSAGTGTPTITYATLTGSTTPLRDGANATVFAILSKSVEATFYYSNSAAGAKASTTAEGTQYLRCSSTTAATVVNSTITRPSTTAPYGTSLVGWATSASTMTTTTVNTAHTAYYAVYRTNNVRINYYSGSAYTTRTDIYRNGVYGTNTNYTMYLATTNTGLSNYATASGPGSSVWHGLSTGADAQAEYYNVGTYNTGAAYSSTNTFYTVYRFNVTYEKGSNVASIGTTDGAGINRCYVSATSTSAGGTSCTVTLPSITPNTGYTAVGWSTTKDATTGTAAGASYTISSNAITLYGNVKKITYSVTYNAGGTCTGATGLPSAQTKTYGVSLTLSSTVPTCSGKVFLGWSTTSSATESSTWYDSGQSYTGNAALTLYAQFYDVNSLEQAYTTYVQYGDFRRAQGSAEGITSTTGGESTNYPSITVPSGYRDTGAMAGWATTTYLRTRTFIPYTSDIKVFHVASGSSQAYYTWNLLVKTRSATTYTDDVDTRIDRLQKLQDVALEYDDIKQYYKLADDVSISAGGHTEREYAAEDGWENIACVGTAASNATNSGTNVNKTWARVCNIQPNGNGRIGYAAAVSSISAKIKMGLFLLETKVKTARTTTFAPTSGKGLARYNALTALNNEKSNYFPNSYIKTSGGIDIATTSYSAWNYGGHSKTVSVPSGKLLGAAAWSFYDSNGSTGGSSRSLLLSAYVNVGAVQSGTISVTHSAGNSSRTSTSGYDQSGVVQYARVLYLSPGTVTVS